MVISLQMTKKYRQPAQIHTAATLFYVKGEIVACFQGDNLYLMLGVTEVQREQSRPSSAQHGEQPEALCTFCNISTHQSGGS